MGTDILLGLALAFVVLGPKRMHSLIGYVGRAKADFDKTSRTIKAQLATQLEAVPPAIGADHDQDGGLGQDSN